MASVVKPERIPAREVFVFRCTPETDMHDVTRVATELAQRTGTPVLIVNQDTDFATLDTQDMGRLGWVKRKDRDSLDHRMSQRYQRIANALGDANRALKDAGLEEVTVDLSDL